MADLAQKIRDRLDGFAPERPAPREHGFSVGTPGAEPLPAAFITRLDDDPMSPQEIEAWQKQWDALLADSAFSPIRVLPPGPKVYPGFEQMRDALLAVVDYTEPGDVFPGEGDGRDHAEKAIDAEVEAQFARVRELIAEKLGIEVPDA